jgi:hypothetical protein
MQSTTPRATPRAAHNSSATRYERPAEARPRSRRSHTTKRQRQEGAPGEPRFPRNGLRSRGFNDAQVGQGAVALVEVEAVPDEELVRNDEADVADRKILDEAPVRAVEERGGDERGRLAQLERLDEVAERQAGVDDVLDDDHVTAFDLGVEVLEQPDPASAAELGLGAVAGELDEVEAVQDRQRAREIRREDEARLERANQQRFAPRVVARDLGAELDDARPDLLRREVDLADPRIDVLYDAIGSLNRSARRSTSRL